MTITVDGLLMVVERGRRVRILGDQQSRLTALSLNDVLDRDERGALVDITAGPDFAQTRYVYVLAIAQRPDAAPAYRVSRFRELNGVLGERAIVLEGVPVSQNREPGAVVRVGPDGRLYAAFGDFDDHPVAQDLGRLNGKILRLAQDGSTPRDNPRPSPIFSFGHHSPVGLAWHPATGALWEVERGPNSNDHLNVVSPNRDYGWPEARLAPADGLQTQVGLGDSLAPIGAAFYNGRIERFRGDLFFVSRTQRALYRVRFDAANHQRVVQLEPLLANQLGPLGGVVSGPDGAVYVFTTKQNAPEDEGSTGDSVYRIAPVS